MRQVRRLRFIDWMSLLTTIGTLASPVVVVVLAIVAPAPDRSTDKHTLVDCIAYDQEVAQFIQRYTWAAGLLIGERDPRDRACGVSPTQLASRASKPPTLVDCIALDRLVARLIRDVPSSVDALTHQHDARATGCGLPLPRLAAALSVGLKTRHP